MCYMCIFATQVFALIDSTAGGDTRSLMHCFASKCLMSTQSTMVSNQEFDKLRQAIEIVVNKQLMDNHDDTLIEKLLTHVEDLVNSQDLDDDQILRLLTLLNTTITDAIGEDATFTEETFTSEPNPQAIKLIAILLNRFSVNGCLSEIPDTAMASFILAVSLVTPESDVSLQSSVVLSLRLFLHQSDFLISIKLTNARMQWNPNSKCINFLQILYLLMTKSPSYFVRHDAESLLQDICHHHPSTVSDWSSTGAASTRYLAQLVKEIINTPIRENVRFVNSLMIKPALKRVLSRSGLRETMEKHLHEVMDSHQPLDVKLFHDLIQVVGQFYASPKIVDKVINFCVKRNDLKGLIIFTCQLASQDREYLNKFLLYSVYTLVAKTDRRIEISQQMMTSLREKSFVEKNTDYSEILCALNRLENTFVNLDDKGLLVVEALQILIQSKITKRKSPKPFNDKKIVSQALICLEKAMDHDLIPEVDFIDLICDLIMEAFDCLPSEGNSLDYLNDLLSMAKRLWSNLTLHSACRRSIIEKTMPTVTKLMQSSKLLKTSESNGSESLEGDWRINCIENIMDAVVPLTSAEEFATSRQLIESFQFLWQNYHHDKTFLSSVIPILFAIDFEVDVDSLSSVFGWSRHKEVLDLLSEYLLDPFLADKVIEVITDDDNLPRIQQLKSDNHDVFKKLLSSICLFTLRSVDSELQRKVFKFFHEIIANEKNRNELSVITNDLQLFYSSGFLTTVMMVHESELYCCNNIRVLAFEISELIRDTLFTVKLDADALKSILEKEPEPQFFHCKETLKPLETGDESSKLPSRQDRVDVIEDIFQGFVRQPTLDLIQELNGRSEEGSVNTCATKIHANERIDLEKLCYYYTKTGVYVPTQSFSVGIVDDILAAKETLNAAAMDCY